MKPSAAVRRLLSRQFVRPRAPAGRRSYSDQYGISDGLEASMVKLASGDRSCWREKIARIFCLIFPAGADDQGINPNVRPSMAILDSRSRSTSKYGTSIVAVPRTFTD